MDANPSICWKIMDTSVEFHVSACVIDLVETIDVTASVSLDTDAGTSNPPGFTCAPLTDSGTKSDNVCALAASTITIQPGVTFSAHGAKPLALLGHSIDIEGTVDVASHIGGQRGAGAAPRFCSPGPAATAAGGGAGGTINGLGGKGGNQGGSSGSGAPLGNSITASLFRGGCDGGRGGDGSPNGGPAATGGAGGGALWIATDTGTLKMGGGATINASGAGGAGGTANNHGGFGGGSGGVIVLQAPSILLDPSATLFANGGHGGGGALGTNPGSAGTDAAGPNSGGTGGEGGMIGVATGGAGGAGYPGRTNDGADGDGPLQGGGGGGGGAEGAILAAPGTTINASNKLSPTPTRLTN
jgi:hypothetical protein